MGIKEKLTELNLPLEYADGSFAATINLIDIDEAKKIAGYLSYYGVKITKASELKWYTLEEEKLKQLLARLQYCYDAKIPLTDDNGNNYDYVFNNKRFIELYPDANLSIVSDVFRDKETIKSDSLKTLEDNVSVGLTEDTYERYLAIDSLLTQVLELLLNLGYDMSANDEVYNSISKLVSMNNVIPDEEILFSALVYKQNRSEEEIAIITNAINAVINSRREEQMNR